MKKWLLFSLFLYTINSFSQISHKDSIVVQSGKGYNYNIFQFNKDKILVKLGEDTTFISNDANLENSYICYLTEDNSMGIIIHPANYDYISDLESFGYELQKKFEKEEGYIVLDYKITSINGINSLHFNYVYKENGVYVLGSQYIINTKRPIAIQIILKTTLFENADTFLKEYVPMFQTLVKENVIVYPDYYK